MTGAFTCGAEEALRLALENGCTAAILKARSPSCGSGEIYDGSFTGTRVPGEGVFARMARKAGLEIWSGGGRSPKEDSFYAQYIVFINYIIVFCTIPHQVGAIRRHVAARRWDDASA